MNIAFRVLFLLPLLLIGCKSDALNDWSDFFVELRPVTDESLHYREMSTGELSTNNTLMLKASGEIFSEDGGEMPDDIVSKIRSSIGELIRRRGGAILGESDGGGVVYHTASGVVGMNTKTASLYFSDEDISGIISFYLIERDYSFDGEVKAQLLFFLTVNKGEF
jgi:hypothetical protein